MAILKFINEYQDFNHIYAFTTTASAYVDTTRVTRGYYLGTSGNDSATLEWPAAGGNDLWFHGRFGGTSLSTLWDVPRLFEYRDSNNNLVFQWGPQNGILYFEIFGDTSPVATQSWTIGSANMYDLHFSVNGTTSIDCEVFRDGISIATLTAGNTVNHGLPKWCQMHQYDDNSGRSFYFSEMVIADEDTRGWRLRMHSAVSFGAVSDWDGSANAVVGESIANGVRSNTLDERVSFGLSRLENLPSGVTVDRVAIQSYTQRAPTGLASMNHFFRYEDTTIEDSTDFSISESGGLDVEEFTTSPDTGLAWTDTEMQGLQFGVRSRT